ncbi:PepSY domain-containing protein [Psychrobacillus sp. FSL K6-2684]|uniref:PepSY domain-containing protein n=1 Tax=Psychrobacillus sp. FSL K6-2684 TaxID=2921547 RepID=UPI0030FBFDE8
MKFTKIKKYSLIFVSVTVIVGTGFLLNVTQSNRNSISESEVRSQIEQLYGAEVTDITLKEDVYKALITKSGTVYLVEINPENGDVYSLEQTTEYMIEDSAYYAGKTQSATFDDTFEVMEYPLTSNIRQIESNNNIVVEMSPITQIEIKENNKNSINKVETAQATEIRLIKSSISATSKIEEKTNDTKVDKPITEVIKNAIKDALKTENTKVEEVKKDTVKENVAKADDTKTEVKTDSTKIDGIKTDSSKSEPLKNEVSKTETSKTESNKTESGVESVKTETSKTETPKAEETKKEEAKKEEDDSKSSTTSTTQSESKKPEELKPEKPATVLITAEQATKIAQQQHKGTVESNSFIKTNEGGYYLIVMQTASTDGESKDSKDKKTKATIQVHAISGKILSVTWE